MIYMRITRLLASISIYQEITGIGLLFQRMSRYNPKQRREGSSMIRKRINTILNKLTDAQLKRVYEFVKYIYIHG